MCYVSQFHVNIIYEMYFLKLYLLCTTQNNVILLITKKTMIDIHSLTPGSYFKSLSVKTLRTKSLEPAPTGYCSEFTVHFSISKL